VRTREAFEIISSFCVVMTIYDHAIAASYRSIGLVVGIDPIPSHLAAPILIMYRSLKTVRSHPDYQKDCFEPKAPYMPRKTKNPTQ
jgi:hypothetical protein